MTTAKRRLLIAIGATLLVGGWGTTRFVHERLMTVPIKDRYYIWVDKSPQIFITGIILMTLGTGLISFSALRTQP